MQQFAHYLLEEESSELKPRLEFENYKVYEPQTPDQYKNMIRYGRDRSLSRILKHIAGSITNWKEDWWNWLTNRNGKFIIITLNNAPKYIILVEEDGTIGNILDSNSKKIEFRINSWNNKEGEEEVALEHFKIFAKIPEMNDIWEHKVYPSIFKELYGEGKFDKQTYEIFIKAVMQDAVPSFLKDNLSKIPEPAIKYYHLNTDKDTIEKYSDAIKNNIANMRQYLINTNHSVMPIMKIFLDNLEKNNDMRKSIARYVIMKDNETFSKKNLNKYTDRELNVMIDTLKSQLTIMFQNSESFVGNISMAAWTVITDMIPIISKTVGNKQ